MNHALMTLLLCAGLFIGMLILSEAGRRIGKARLESDPEGLEKGTGAAEAAVFGLLGLLLAFTFSGAASRFDNRRQLVTQEANAIGTAYLRLDLLPGDAQPELKELFRRYVDVRSVVYQDVEDGSATNAKIVETEALQGNIWTKAMAACRRQDAPAQAFLLLVPALNDMIDITTTRAMSGKIHPPSIIFVLLGGLSLVGALLLGYDTAPNRKRNLFHVIVFAAMMSLAVYVIVDLEYPRMGLIRVDGADQVLIDLRNSMKQAGSALPP